MFPAELKELVVAAKGTCTFKVYFFQSGVTKLAPEKVQSPSHYRLATGDLITEYFYHGFRAS